MCCTLFSPHFPHTKRSWLKYTLYSFLLFFSFSYYFYGQTSQAALTFSYLLIQSDSSCYLSLLLLLFSLLVNSISIPCEKKDSFYVSILALLFALTIYIGTYFQSGYLYASSLPLLACVIMGSFILFRKIFSLCWYAFSRISCSSGQQNRFFDIAPEWNCAALMLLCWAPYFLIRYPGGLSWDGLNQLNQYFGEFPLSNHHPVFSTFLMGWIVDLGRMLLSDNLGLFLYNLFQAVVLAYSLGLSFKVMHYLHTPYWLRRSILLVYCLLTIWPAFAQLLIKDTLYTAFVAIFAYQIIFYLVLGYRDHVRWWVLKLFACSLLVSLLRNNGFYIVLFTAIGVLLQEKRIRAWFITSFCAAIVIYIAIIKVVYPALNIIPGETQEMLSLPFQQTARYAQTYDSTMTQDEKDIINKVLNYESIVVNYNPILSDAVKSTFKNPSSEDFKKYWVLWGKQFLTHPSCYLMATLNQTYGYYCIVSTTMGLGDPYLIETNKDVNTGFFNFHTVTPYAEEGTKLLQAWQSLQMHLPFVGLLFQPAFYFWVLLFLLVKAWQQKCTAIILPVISPLTSFLVCIASPVNAYIRYALPMMAVLPLIFVLSVRCNCLCEKPLKNEQR